MSPDSSITPEELSVYYDELREQVTLMDEGIGELEQDGGNPDCLQQIFRAAHTIKGSSSLVGYEPIASLAHSMESLLDILRNEKQTVNQEDAKALRFSLDKLKKIVDGVITAENGRRDEADIARYRQPAVSPATGSESGGISRNGNRYLYTQSIRVEAGILDSLLGIVEELVIERLKISQAGKCLGEKYPEDKLIDEFSRTSSHFTRTFGELQEYIMQVKMVPAETLFRRFPRMINDLARSQGKNIQFLVEGGDTEIDRTILDRIRDPLTHIFRNAVDHGAEPAHERRAAGKLETAVIRLRAFRERRNIVITVEDDGRGISADRVRECAVRRGIISRAEAEDLSGDEAVNLIFIPGISTVEKATQVSGRGVGMDIVRTNVEYLGGTVTVETCPGKGTRFIIRVPLTAAIVRGLLVSVDGISYAIPMDSVVETIYTGPEQIQVTRGKRCIRWNGINLPLIRLHPAFADRKKSNRDKLLTVIFRAGSSTAALEIDELLEPQEIVVKSSVYSGGATDGVAGVTMLRDGSAALVTDTGRLVATSGLLQDTAPEQSISARNYRKVPASQA